MENYINIGKLVSVHGLKGEMVLLHHLGEGATLEGIAAVFLEETPGKFLPYFMVGQKAKNEAEILLGFEGVETPEQARKLLKKGIWLKEEDVKKTASATAPISFLGFTVFNKKDRLGEVLEVIEQPLQILLRLEIEKKEVLVPLNESTLIGIDRKKQIINVVLPDGLLEIYLS